MSSSPAFASNASASHSFATSLNPDTMASRSSPVMTPARANAAAYPTDPSTSSRHMRRSKDSDSLNFSMSGSWASLNLPPHNFFGSSLAFARVVDARTRRRPRREPPGTVASSVRDVIARADVTMARGTRGRTVHARSRRVRSVARSLVRASPRVGRRAFGAATLLVRASPLGTPCRVTTRDTHTPGCVQ